MSQQTTNRSFDELARALANGSLSRGKALRLMGGLLVGSALGSLPGVAWADDDRCSEGQTRCGDRCVNLQRNERHCGRCFNRCDEGEECVDGVCGGGEPTCTPSSCPSKCACKDLVTGGQACVDPVGEPVSTCEQCPTATFCVATLDPGTFECHGPCLC